MDTTKLKQISITPAVQVIRQALGEDADLHLVGGVVRDVLLGKEPKDVDLATNLTSEEVFVRLKKAGIPASIVGLRRGTVLAVVEHQPFEITTFRDPTNESLPSGSIELDLSARDFTINAIAYSLNKDLVVDPYQGISDLNKELRSVRDASERFKQDPHRILRMVRFGPGQGRPISMEVLNAAKANVSLLQEVNAERIYPELVNILISENPADCLELMLEVGILDLLLPEVKRCFGFEQNKYHKFDVFQHICSVVQATPPKKFPRLAALFHDIGKPDSLTIEEDGSRKFLGHENISAELTIKILTRLKASNQDIKAISTLVALHMKDVRMKKAKIRKLKSELDTLLEDWIFLKRADLLGGGRNLDINILMQEWDEFIVNLQTLETEPPVHKLSNLAINGNDLLALGLKPGPRVGEILNKLHESVMEAPELNTRQALLEAALALI
jgi:tRNA nucleotidyltransferase (CCA-adding enzyme)